MESSPMEELFEVTSHQREQQIRQRRLMMMIGLLEGYTNTGTVLKHKSRVASSGLFENFNSDVSLIKHYFMIM